MLKIGSIGIFLFFLTGSQAFSLSGDGAALETDLVGRQNILFFGGFEQEPWTQDWGLAWGPSPESNGSLVEGPEAFEGRSYRVTYTAGSYGSQGGLEFRVDFSKLPLEPQNSLYLRYYLRFEPGFDFAKGGKLPGLGGGEANTGGHKPNGTDGWSARVMWRADGKIVQYLYYPDQPTEYGEDFSWDYGGCPRFFTPGRWECVETYIQLNDPGKKNGVLRSWLNGEKALEVTGLRFRDKAGLKIDKLLFETFFGGGDPSWASPKTQSTSFDNFVLSKGYIGPDLSAKTQEAPAPAAEAMSQKDGQGLLVYDGDHEAWKPSSWNAGSYDLRSPEKNHTSGGERSVLVQLPSQDWGAVQFEGPPQKSGDFRVLSFWVFPTGCDVEFRVRLEKNGSQTGMEKAVTGGGRVLRANQWNFVEIPLSVFKISGDFNRIVFTSNSSQAVSPFYLDDIYLFKP